MLSETLYEKLTNDDGRVCADISDEACREAPKSFSIILLSLFLTKLGDAIASPKTTLAWMVAAVGAPGWALGFLVPLRESGSMVPQLFIGGVIRRLAVRKWVWIAGSVGQFVCIAGLGLTAWFLEGAAAGWAMLAWVALFSLARGFCSLAVKDVLGKTIPKPKRGRLTGWSSSLAGLIAIGLGLVLMIFATDGFNASKIGWALIGAGSLWLVAALIFSQVPEFPGATDGARSARQSMHRLSLLVTDAPFRTFVLTRALLMCSALSAPYYVALSQESGGLSVGALGAFIVAAGVASMVSSPFWGRFADQSSKWVMVMAALVTAGTGLLTFAVARLAPALLTTEWFLPIVYFSLSVAHSGVRVGRKTYVVNLGTGNDRTDYVAISNTVIGVLLLLVGLVGILTPIIGADGVIGALALMGLGGAALGSSMQDVE